MGNRLNEYKQKRNFDNTLEPEGEAGRSSQAAKTGEAAKADKVARTTESVKAVEAHKPAEIKNKLRFVVQHHIARNDHFDFRLEWDGILLSWAVPKGPSYNTRDKRLAIQVEDHPLEYRNFEGTIPKGEYGGGVVMLWDEGYWEPYGDVEDGLREGSLKFILKGIRLMGKWALVRLKAKAGEKKDNWLLIKERDEYAKASEGVSEFTTSVRTGRTMQEIEDGSEERFARNPFDTTDVQLAKLVNAVPEGNDWLYEMKYDGYRIMAFVEGNSVRLQTRNGNDYTKRFQSIASSVVDWANGRAMVLDGEMVVVDESGRTDFQALQTYMRNPGAQDLTYIIFDLLALDGLDLRGNQLIDRKEKLEMLMKEAPKNLVYSRHVPGNGEKSFEAACSLGMEGIVGKKADSVYSGTRNGDWIKLKCDKRQDFVIGGYSLSHKKTSGVSSILLGVYEDDELIYAGRAGSGFGKLAVRSLEPKFNALKRATSPFKLAPKARKNERITWLEPELVAEIKFAELTEDNLLRHASYKGLQTDKNPKDIRREKAEVEPAFEEEGVQHKGGEAGGRFSNPSGKEKEKPEKAVGNSLVVEGIKISSPDKILFDNPQIKKIDVIRYYQQVSERMLPYVSRRILSIVRCPKGVSQTCFYKKHPGLDGKGIVTFPISDKDGETEDYFYIENITGLIYEAQMGTVEFHIWGSRVDELERPDMMVFDLDPDEGMDIGRVRQGVRDIKDILAELSLTSYLKTSGGKGYHVVVPFTPAVSWDIFYDFAKRVAEVMEQKWPDRYTSNIRKNKRAGKIFIDWIRNGRGATSIAPYSLRARRGAKVSMPIGWEELDSVEPDGIDMTEALVRFGQEDPWKDFFRINQGLK
jgi:bifunctional non-homologous end joining protein LigD